MFYSDMRQVCLGSAPDSEARHLLHLLHDLVLPLVFGDGANEEATVVQTHAHADELPRPDLIVVQHLDGSLRCISAPINNQYLIKEALVAFG